MTEITSRTNDNVKALCAVTATAASRRSNGVALLETEKLVRDAMQGGADCLQLWLCGEAAERCGDLAVSAEAVGARVFLTVPSVMQKISREDSGTNVLALVRRPQPRQELRTEGLNRILVLENVQDPGNVGTALRSAAAFGFDAVLLSPGCADPFGPKALRASMGAAFRIPVFEQADCVGEVTKLGREGFLTVAAALDRDAVRLDACPAEERVCVAVGSEGRGLTEELISACGRTVFIPISAGTESLNAAAAAAVLMWHYRNNNL